MQERIFWFKDGLRAAADCTTNIMSPTAQFGINVFEGLRGYFNDAHGELYIFRLREHLERLTLSCKLIGFEMPYTIGEIEGFLREVVAANNYRQDIAVRVILFLDEEGSWNSRRKPELVIAPIARSRSDFATTKGLSATISSWRRIDDNAMPPRVKAGANYLNGRYAHLDAARKGFDVPVFLGTNGKLSEGAGSCIFIVRNGTLITPPVTDSLLDSITRSTIISLAERDGVTVEERSIDRTELLMADEAFLCGTAVEISPIVSVDGLPVGTGDKGPISEAMARAYLACVSAEVPLDKGWNWAVNGS